MDKERITANAHMRLKRLYLHISTCKIADDTNPSVILVAIFIILGFLGYFLQRE